MNPIERIRAEVSARRYLKRVTAPMRSNICGACLYENIDREAGRKLPPDCSHK